MCAPFIKYKSGQVQSFKDAARPDGLCSSRRAGEEVNFCFTLFWASMFTARMSYGIYLNYLVTRWTYFKRAGLIKRLGFVFVFEWRNCDGCMMWILYMNHNLIHLDLVLPKQMTDLWLNLCNNMQFKYHKQDPRSKLWRVMRCIDERVKYRKSTKINHK